MSWNVTNRLLEFSPSPEATVVNRILTELHKQIDTKFPDADVPPRQFSKTVFAGGEGSEGIESALRKLNGSLGSKLPADAHFSKAKGNKSEASGKARSRRPDEANSSRLGEFNASSQPGKFSLDDDGNSIELSQIPIPDRSRHGRDISSPRGKKSRLRIILVVTVLAILFLGLLLLTRQ